MKNSNTLQQDAAKSKLLSIIPLSSFETPYNSWEKYKTEVAPIPAWRSHLLYGGNVGIITGEVSGGLQVIILNDKNDIENFVVEYYLHQIPYKLLDKLLVIITPENTYQIIFRCLQKTTSEVLTWDRDESTLVEAMGEGEYFCFNKHDYYVIQGKFDLESFNIQIPELTEEECDFLLQAGRNCQKYYI